MCRSTAAHAGAVALVGLLAACSTAATAAPPAGRASPSVHAAKTAPPGVPEAVFKAALSALDVPGNRITQPVQWIQTSFAAYERAAQPGSSGTAAAERTQVYVVQVRGSFAFTNSWVAGGSHAPAPYTVNGMVMSVGGYVAGTDGGYESNTPVDLAKIAPAHTFVMP
jgi:hypothetical protein